MKRQREATEEVCELVKLAQKGDRGAVVRLLGLVVPRVSALVKGALPSLHEPDDVVQDVVLRLLRGLKSLREPRRFWPWLHGIVRNRIRDLLRRQRTEFELTDQYEADRGDPVREAMRKEEATAVRRALEGLSELDREVVLLRHWAGASYEEIAEILGLTVSAVQSRLFRARRDLAARLGPLLGRTGKPPKDQKDPEEGG